MASETCSIIVNGSHNNKLLIETLCNFLRRWGWQIDVTGNVLSGTWKDRSIEGNK